MSNSEDFTFENTNLSESVSDDSNVESKSLKLFSIIFC